MFYRPLRIEPLKVSTKIGVQHII